MVTSEPMDPFAPLLSIEIEPKTRVDQERLDRGLQTLMTEDPMVRVHTDRQTGRTTILGTGELQLETVVERLEHEFNVDATVGKPRVVYKETVTCEANGDGRYAAQRGGRGQYGHVKIHLYPGEPGTGYVFVNEAIGGSIPDAFIKPIDEGVKEARTRGVLSGYPIDDVRIELYDGSYHDVDSSEAAFRIAGAMAFRDAAKRANPVVLEPVMRVEVVGPTDCIGSVAADLASRRGGHIQSHEDRSGAAIIVARVPFSEILGYGNDLHFQTQGRATYSIFLQGFEPLHGDPEWNEGDRSAPVRVPRVPKPTGRESAIAVPEPDAEEGSESAP